MLFSFRQFDLFFDVHNCLLFFIQAGAPLFRQLTNAYSEENAVEDSLYFLGRALGEGALDCEGYLKQVLDQSNNLKLFNVQNYAKYSTFALCILKIQTNTFCNLRRIYLAISGKYI